MPIITKLVFGQYISVHGIGIGLVNAVEQCIKSEASVKFAYKAGFTQRLFITLESKGVHLKPPGMLITGQIVVPLAEEWQRG